MLKYYDFFRGEAPGRLAFGSKVSELQAKWESERATQSLLNFRRMAMGELALGLGREVIAIVTADIPPRISQQTRGMRQERQPKYTPHCSNAIHAGTDKAHIFKHKLQGLQLSCHVLQFTKMERGCLGWKKSSFSEILKGKTHDVNLSNTEGCARMGKGRFVC